MSCLKRLIDRTLNPETGSSKVKPAITPDSIPENLEIKVRPNIRLRRTPPPEPVESKAVQANPLTRNQPTNATSDKSFLIPSERSGSSEQSPPTRKEPPEPKYTASRADFAKKAHSEYNVDERTFLPAVKPNSPPQANSPVNVDANEKDTFDFAPSKHNTELTISAEQKVERLPIKASLTSTSNESTIDAEAHRIQKDTKPAKVYNGKLESRQRSISTEAQVPTQGEPSRKTERKSLRNGNTPAYLDKEEVPVETVSNTRGSEDVIKQVAQDEQPEIGPEPLKEPTPLEPTPPASGDSLKETPMPSYPHAKPLSKPGHKIEVKSEKTAPKDENNEQIPLGQIEDRNFYPHVESVAPAMHETRYQSIQEPSETVVTINIGRIEVKAIPPVSPTTEPKAEFSPPLTLSDYLKQRAEGKRG